MLSFLDSLYSFLYSPTSNILERAENTGGWKIFSGKYQHFRKCGRLVHCFLKSRKLFSLELIKDTKGVKSDSFS